MRSEERPDGARARRRRGAAGPFAVVALVLAALSGPGADTGARSGASAGVAHTARAAAPAAPSAPARAGREKCADGSYADESLKSSKASGPAVKRIKERDRLVVGVDQSSYLWGFRDPATGDFAGFDIDLVKAVGEDLLGPDPHLTFKTVPTADRVGALRRGDVDMIVRTMTLNCERKTQVAFSTAYFEAGQQLVVPRSSKRVTGFDRSLKGARVCVAESSTAEALLKEPRFARLRAEPVVVDNQLDCLVRMQLGRTDATLTDNALGAGQAAQDPTVELVGEPETMEFYGVAMNLRDEDLVRRVNKALEDYRDDGWPESYRKWLKGSIRGKGIPDPPKPRYRD